MIFCDCLTRMARRLGRGVLTGVVFVLGLSRIAYRILRLFSPALALAQRRDMRDVVLAMPGVQRDQPIQRAQPVFGMAELALEIGILHIAQDVKPAFVDSFEQRE
jgi:hypothetical protein